MKVSGEVLSMQMLISRSVIDISENVFEKGDLPDLNIIEKDASYDDICCVTLQNNAFIYYGDDENDKTGYRINPYDIQTDAKVSLQIKKSFRYWELRDNVEKVYPTGLALCDPDGNPVEKFNNYSYFLSNNSIIKLGMYIPLDNSIQTSAFGAAAYTSGAVQWREVNGLYKYEWQIIWDKERNIQSIPQYSTINSFQLAKGGKGVQIIFGSGNKIGYQALVRLKRTFNNNTVRYADIPLCGSRYLYDYGDTVNGYKWQNQAPLPANPIKLSDGESILFAGENVQLTASSFPQSGIWKKGDIIFNISNTNNALWIYNGNLWSAK